MDSFFKEFGMQIINKVTADSIVDLLWSASIITYEERNNIQNLSTGTKRKKMVDCLINKDYHHLKTFIQILRDSTAGIESLITSMAKFLDARDENGVLKPASSITSAPAEEEAAAAPPSTRINSNEPTHQNDGRMVEESYFHYISTTICQDAYAGNKLQLLYGAMDLPYAELKFLNRAEPEPYGFLMECLTRWSNKHVKNATWKALDDVLRGLRCNKAADKIKELKLLQSKS